MLRLTFVAAGLLLAGCSADEQRESADPLDAFEMELVETYLKKPKGYSRAYALHKQTAAGPDWLATIHGYPNNKEVCEQLIKPYNSGEMPSDMPGFYFCEELSSE